MFSYTIRKVLAGIFLVAITFFVYSFSLRGPFIWDDQPLIRDNPEIRNVNNIGSVFLKPWSASPGVKSNLYRPLPTATFIVDYFFYKSNTAGYHLTNILIHLLAVFAVFCFIRFFTGSFAAYCAALVFSIMPVNVETVANISARTEMLSALFSVVMLFFYFKFYNNSRRIYFFAVILSLILGLFSKESALIVFVVCLAYHICFRLRPRTDMTLALVLVAVLYFYWRQIIFGGILFPFSFLGNGGYSTKFLSFAGAFFGYCKMLIWPFTLHMEYMDKPLSFYDHRVAAGLFLVFVCMMMIIFFLRRNKVMVFSLVWFVFTILPFCGIFPLPFYIADHYMYFPLMGLLTGFAVFVDRYAVTAVWKSGFIIIFASAVICWVTISAVQNRYWSNAAYFYKRTLTFSPGSERIMSLLGVEYLDNGQLDKAMVVYDDFLILNPQSFPAHYGKGVVYFEQGDFDKALQEFSIVIKLNPLDYMSYYNIGCIYYLRGLPDKACSFWKSAVMINPDYGQALNNIRCGCEI